MIFLETIRAETHPELWAEFASTCTTDARPFLHVGCTILAQIHSLTHDIAELEHVTGDLVWADLLLLEELHDRLFIFTHHVPIRLWLCALFLI